MSVKSDDLEYSQRRLKSESDQYDSEKDDKVMENKS
jgi:hypothetical protein